MARAHRNHWSRRVRLAAAVAAAIALAPDHTTATAGTGPATPADPCGALAWTRADAPRPKCCFTNPAYAGVCVVEPAENETCASILEYLNSDQAAGKTYCGATTVRGGWAAAQCPADSGPGGGEGR